MIKKYYKWLPLVCAFFVIAMIAPGHIKAIPVSATMSDFSGEVQVMTPGGSWQPAKLKMLLPNGTMIKTGAKSSAVIKWGADNTIKLTPFSNFAIKSIDIDPRTKTVSSSLDLTTGKAKTKAEKLQNPNSEFTVTTPTAVAGVRGTVFDIENTPDNETSITTYSGSVDVTANGQTVPVDAGESVTVNPGEAPGEPQPVPEEEKNICEDDDDCWSQHCVDGKCVDEEAATQGGGCRDTGGACEMNDQCCSRKCMDGLCEAVTTAAGEEAACIPEGAECAAADECCSKACGDDGKCKPKLAEAAAECVKGGENCAADDECCSKTCGDDGKCVEEAAVTAAGAICVNAGGACAANEECCSEVCGSDGICSEAAASAGGCINKGVECTTNEDCCSGLCDGGICAVEPPILIINSPAEGFLNCPYVTISGMTNPGSSVFVNGVNLMGLAGANAYSDGSFSVEGFKLDDCTAPLVFQAIDAYGQTARQMVSSGATNDAALLGVNLAGVDLILSPTGQWINGYTMVEAKVTARSTTPFSGALAVTFYDADGMPVGNVTLMPIFGLTASAADVDGAAVPTEGAKRRGISRTGYQGTERVASDYYYAQAIYMLMTGPANPLTISARIGDLAVVSSSIVVRRPVCMANVMVPGDGNDNDCDGLVDEDPKDGLDNDMDGRVDEDQPAVGSNCNNGSDDDNDRRVDEESPDGIDNDGDGRIDEDLKCECDYADPFADCDGDAILNGDDCNPFDGAITDLKDSATCANSCNAVSTPEADCDRDGLTNAQEFALETNPYMKDTDGDQFSDLQEINDGTDPRNPASNSGLLAYQDIITGGCPNGQVPGTDGACVCPPDTKWDDFNQFCVPTGACMGGMIQDSTGGCICPAGTVWDEMFMACIVPSYTQCESGTYFDPMVGGCTSACSGGQIEDPTTRQCYCAPGAYMDTFAGYCRCPEGTEWDAAIEACVDPNFIQCPAGQYFDPMTNGCVATCPNGMIPDPINGFCYCGDGAFDASTGECGSMCPPGMVFDNAFGECKCDATAPYYDGLAGTCVASCSGGQVGDPMFGACVCPTGSYLDYFMQQCVATTSYTICPVGTSGQGCDTAFASRDCDGDGIPNSDDAMPCVNDYGVDVGGDGTIHQYCPDGSDAAQCDMMTNPDCDNDGATNDYDPCPCMWGAMQSQYCPSGPMGCPEGQFLDEYYGSCGVTCREPMIPDTVTKNCVCPAGTWMDWNTGICSGSCPTGMVPSSDGGYCVCGPDAPYMDQMTGTCVARCQGGQTPDPDSGQYCVCPFGSGLDFNLGMCTCGYDETGKPILLDSAGMCPLPDVCLQRPYAMGCPCNYDTDCDAGISCLFDQYIGIKVCQQSSANICNYNGACDYFQGEDSYNCQSDCLCDFDRTCDYDQGETEYWCADCQGSCGDGRCDFDLGAEDNATCPQDCLCNNNNTCEPPGEVFGWCPTDCDCQPDGAYAPGPADCCNNFDACTSMCTSQPPSDMDGDFVPDNCDSCPQEQGPDYNGGCPTGCQFDSDCIGMAGTPYCDVCTGFICVAQQPLNTDGDHLPDACDQCPNEPGTPELGGCPQGGDIPCWCNMDCGYSQYCPGGGTGSICAACDIYNGSDSVCCNGEQMTPDCGGGMCGDSICDPGEETSCPADCAPDCGSKLDQPTCDGTMGCMWDGYHCVVSGGGGSCGNAICEFSLGETNTSCSVDCLCNYDTICDSPGETSDWCTDCTAGAVCGNAVCEFSLGETNAACSADCLCNYDTICDSPGETSDWCTDCTAGPVCGNAVCEFGQGETNASCAADCLCNYDATCNSPGEASDWCTDCTGGAVCGNAVCEFSLGETNATCSADCLCNFDAICNSPGETSDWCTDCIAGAVCGNNTVETPETCDDGNTTSGDGCSDVCQTEGGPVCGNNTVETPETCDDGNTTSGDGCSNVCQTEGGPVCGNNTIETPETCDDGNTTSGDGCSNVCQTE